jgi:DNA-binding NarL/FixJ family response regulator
MQHTGPRRIEHVMHRKENAAMDLQALHPATRAPTQADAGEADTVLEWRGGLGRDDLLEHQAEFEQHLARLSQTELTVLALMARGLLNKQIAHACGTAQSTIKSHVTQVLRKLRAHSRTAAAVRYAVHVERLRHSALMDRPSV